MTEGAADGSDTGVRALLDKRSHVEENMPAISAPTEFRDLASQSLMRGGTP
jgi:hypothetical protein